MKVRLTHGFLLIEALCGLALLSISMICVGYSYATITHQYSAGAQRLRAVAIAQNYRERLIATRTEVLNSEVLSEILNESLEPKAEHQRHDVQIHTHRIYPNGLPARMTTVAVSWQERGTTETIQLCAGVYET